jgi:predicted HNH restriction endonuclease
MTEEENGKKLQVHHIVPFFNFADYRKANALKNLVSLCLVCHRREEAKVPAKQMTLFGKLS